MLRFAIQVCFDAQEKEHAVLRVWDVCVDLYQLELSRGKHQQAIRWFVLSFHKLPMCVHSRACFFVSRGRMKELLLVKPRCLHSERAWTFGNIGECFLRERDFEQAEFYLQTALALEPRSKSTLKSLVRSDLNRVDKQPRFVNLH